MSNVFSIVPLPLYSISVKHRCKISRHRIKLKGFPSLTSCCSWRLVLQLLSLGVPLYGVCCDDRCHFWKHQQRREIRERTQETQTHAKIERICAYSACVLTIEDMGWCLVSRTLFGVHFFSGGSLSAPAEDKNSRVTSGWKDKEIRMH